MPDKSTDRYPDWDLLDSWVAVVEAGSISDAAERLHISQAGVSQRVKTLEALMDTTLLDRTTRPAKPTAAGQRLFEHAMSLLLGADQMMEGVRNVTRARRVVVRIGCVDSCAATIGPTIIRALSGTSHQIRLWSGITPTLDAQLVARQLDIAVTTSEALQAPGLRTRRIFTEPFIVVLPKSAQIEPPVSLADYSKQLPFIRYSARSAIGKQVDDYLSVNAETVERTCEFDATDPMVSLVAAGLGFALTTALCLWQSRHFLPEIRVVPLSSFSRYGKPLPELRRSFFLSYRANELGQLPSDLYDVVQTVYERQVSRDIAAALNMPHEALCLATEA